MKARAQCNWTEKDKRCVAFGLKHIHAVGKGKTFGDAAIAARSRWEWLLGEMAKDPQWQKEVV